MKSNVIVAKHPLHPILVPIPATSFPLALLGDFAYLGTGELFWHQFALWTIGIGILGALLAALPGLVDYVTIVPGEARKTASTHMVLNLSMVGLFIINLAIRLATSATNMNWVALETVLSVVGVATMFYAAWLGGHMVYHYRIGVEEKGQVENAGFRITLSPEDAKRRQQR